MTDFSPDWIDRLIKLKKRSPKEYKEYLKDYSEIFGELFEIMLKATMKFDDNFIKKKKRRR